MRQDFESPLCTSEQLRLKTEEVICFTAQDTSSVEELGCKASEAICREAIYDSSE